MLAEERKRKERKKKNNAQEVNQQGRQYMKARQLAMQER